MSNPEKPKLTVAANNPDLEITVVDKAREYEELVSQYQCGVEEKPEWCVWGNDFKGGKTVIWWIRPSENGEWAARRIAKYLSDDRRPASAQMTEWNPDLTGDPVYGKHPPEAEDILDGPEVWHG